MSHGVWPSVSEHSNSWVAVCYFYFRVDLGRFNYPIGIYMIQIIECLFTASS